MSESETPFKVGLGVWFCFCVLISMWMFTKFMKGKQQVFCNLHVVEDSLAKMQEQLELSLRKKSMGCLETLDDFKENEEQNQEEEADKLQVQAENEFDKAISTEGETGDCKKNV